MLQTIYFNSKQQTTWFPLQSNVIPLKSDALFHPSLPHFSALLEGFFWDATQLHHYSPLGGLHAFKTGPLMIHWAWGKEKSNTEQDQVNREVVPVRLCSSPPGTAGCAGRCEQGHCRGEAAMICPATTLVSSRALSEANTTGSLCRLALWQELTVDNVSDIEECDQHDFDF